MVCRTKDRSSRLIRTSDKKCRIIDTLSRTIDLQDYRTQECRDDPIIYTIRQSSIQHTTFNQLNITKQIFINMYHFPSTLLFLTYQDSFIEYAIYRIRQIILLILQLSCLSSEFQHYSMDCEFQCHSLFKQGLPQNYKSVAIV